MIGVGTFGKVYLATMKGKCYAIKMLKKANVIEQKGIENVKNEITILTQMHSPFNVNFMESF